MGESDNKAVSVCGEMLTGAEELVSAWQLLGSVKTDNRLDARDSWLLAAESFGCDLQAVSDATDDWLLVDWLMRNTDRHYNNFGQDAHRAQATRAGQELGQIRPRSTRAPTRIEAVRDALRTKVEAARIAKQQSDRSRDANFEDRRIAALNTLTGIGPLGAERGA